jgi:hypothetical protein
MRRAAAVLFLALAASVGVAEAAPPRLNAYCATSADRRAAVAFRATDGARLVGVLLAMAALGMVALGAITYVEQRSFLFERAEQQAAAALGPVDRELGERGFDVPGRERGDGPSAMGDRGPGRGPGREPQRGVSFPPETYGERREESALRRSGRPVPDAAFHHFQPVDLNAVDRILDEYDYDPKLMLPILEATQAAYGYLPVAALKHISQKSGAWYAYIYGTASFYGHLRFEPAMDVSQAAAVDAARPAETSYVAGLDAALGTRGRRPGSPARA